MESSRWLPWTGVRPAPASWAWQGRAVLATGLPLAWVEPQPQEGGHQVLVTAPLAGPDFQPGVGALGWEDAVTAQVGLNRTRDGW